MEEKMCQICGKTFLCHKSKKGIYCSKLCQYKGKSKKLKEKPLNYWLGKKILPHMRKALDRTGKKHTEEWKKKRRGIIDEKSPSWKGDNVGYDGLHRWVYKKLGRPTKCEHCEKIGLNGKYIQWANKSGKYLRKLDDWLRLCGSCHSKYDDKGTKIWITRRKKYGNKK